MAHVAPLPLCRGHFIIFSGGMPRASYGDRHCVSVLQAETLVTLDFTSRIIDFFTVHSTQPEDGMCPALPHPVPSTTCGHAHLPCPTEFDEPQALAVLLEEELVVLDLQTPGWPAVPAPYLAPLHSSAITCSAHVANVPAKLWSRIVSAGEQQSPLPASSASVCTWASCSGRSWGGKVFLMKDTAQALAWGWECDRCVYTSPGCQSSG